MSPVPLVSILDVIKNPDNEKIPCELCNKPVAVPYRIRLDDGGVLTLCKSDLHRILTMKHQTKKSADQAEPLFSGNNERIN